MTGPTALPPRSTPTLVPASYQPTHAKYKIQICHLANSRASVNARNDVCHGYTSFQGHDCALCSARNGLFLNPTLYLGIDSMRSIPHDPRYMSAWLVLELPMNVKCRCVSSATCKYWCSAPAYVLQILYQYLKLCAENAVSTRTLATLSFYSTPWGHDLMRFCYYLGMLDSI